MLMQILFIFVVVILVLQLDIYTFCFTVIWYLKHLKGEHIYLFYCCLFMIKRGGEFSQNEMFNLNFKKQVILFELNLSTMKAYISYI